MERYQRYHWNGRGRTRSSRSIPLSTGTTVHEALSGVLQACLANPKVLDGHHPKLTLLEALAAPELSWLGIRPLLRPAIQAALASYHADVAKTGFMDTAPEESQYLMAEQSCLAAGLVWGWVRSQLPTFLREFEVLETEQEDLLQVGEHLATGRPIVYMLRPDVLVRRRRDKRLYTVDWKTAYSLEESWQGEFVNSVQMATQGLGAETRLGEPIVGYYVGGLFKGSRRSSMIDVGDGTKVKGPRRQTSVFCYGYMNPGNPPIQEFDWISEWTRRKGYSKAAVWQDYPGGVEQLAFDMPEALLHQQFLLLGPFERNTVVVERWLKEAPTEEGRWIDKLAAIEAGEPIEAHVTSSWACSGFDGPCPYVPLCFNEPSAELLYEPRQAHHAEEAKFLEGQ
jgi:hypothetical protein